MTKKQVVSLLCVLVSAVLSCAGRGSEVLVEAENFSVKGGWKTDQQFMDIMGSAYLIAHGMGKQVADAQTDLRLPSAGRWFVYVRTCNWTAPWCNSEGPGAFFVAVNGQNLSETVGNAGQGWEWQYAGEFRTTSRKVSVSLKDLTGFDGRCDAIYFTKKAGMPAEAMEDLRNRLYPAWSVPTREESYDFVVVGGGIAGICAAVSAARQGMKVCLIHDRPALGGNNSAEVRVHLGGLVNLEPYPMLGNLLREFGHVKKGNAGNAEDYQDWKKDALVAGEKNVVLRSPWHVTEVEKNGSAISAVLARHIESGELIRVKAPLFADCSGDANLGYLAGADWTMGREGYDSFGEKEAPQKADSLVLGASVQWNTRDVGKAVSFPRFNYGVDFCDESARHVKKGEWTWETGLNKNQILQAEQIRDYGLLIVYSNWSFLKNKASDRDVFANRELDWVAYIMGKRESRRLLGDYVLTGNDVEADVRFPDGTASTSWSIDLHYPDPANSSHFPGNEFLSICKQIPVPHCAIPYRCLYSRNVDNLFMAGRNISVSHVALGTTRVMRTTAMLGEVVGLAASVCHSEKCLPRAVYQMHFDGLKTLMKRGAGSPDAPDTQNFNSGQIKKAVLK